MGDFKKLKHIEFQAVLVDPDRSYQGGAFELLRMLCYPLTKQKGSKSVKVQLVVKINGVIYEVVEQNQHRVSDVNQIDLKLARYYFLLRNYGPEDWEECLTEFENPRMAEVVFETLIQEF